MRLVDYIKTIIRGGVNSYVRFRRYQLYSKQFKSYLQLHNFKNEMAPGEEDYLKKWHQLCNRVEPYSYRFFSHFCGYTPNIVPEDVGRSFIEGKLNLSKYLYAYQDKNLFPEIVGKSNTPRTIVCRINDGALLDSNYNLADKELSFYVGNAKELILKPSVDSCSGRGIVKFQKDRNLFKAVDSEIVLNKEFLYNYNSDFVLQEAVSQHAFMSKLCPTSVNTIRLALYRSVKSNETIVTAGIIRIGRDGAFVDNAHAGGMFVGVSVESGTLGKYVVDQYGNKTNKWNNIDYSSELLVVPFWKKVIEFAKYVGTRVHHHRLLALDIALDEQGRPILIEYNLDGFSYWLFMYTNQEVFGKYTDEVIEYCRSKVEPPKKF